MTVPFSAYPGTFSEAAIGSLPQFAPLPKNFAPGAKADVVIVGAGYTGISTALHLAEMAKAGGRNLRIVVLEKGKLGCAASGHAVGHIESGFQIPYEAALRRLGPALMDRLYPIVNQGPELVKDIIARYRLDCDVRDSYLTIASGQHAYTHDGSKYGIEPFRYLYGMAQAAQSHGVDIYEHTPVLNISDEASKQRASVETQRGVIEAPHIIATGGHIMAESIPALRGLRNRTVQQNITTIVTPPLPDSVLETIGLKVDGVRIPFVNDKYNVAYGTVDRHNRLIFGSRNSAGTPNARGIEADMHAMFPTLRQAYRTSTGKELECKIFTDTIPITFTLNALPDVGSAGRTRHACALGGHGIALGTVIGRSLARAAYGEIAGQKNLGNDFALFSQIRHQRIPAFLRRPISYAGQFLYGLRDKAQGLPFG